MLKDDCLLVGDAPVETLRGEDTKFGFSQVEPGTVLWRIVPFESFDQTPGLGRELRHFRWLEAALRGIDAPSLPPGRFQGSANAARCYKSADAWRADALRFRPE
jgi:hypothetical protein